MFVRVLFAAISAVLLSAPVTLAQEWPTKPIRVVIPFGAGSATDVIPRIVMDGLAKRLGQPIIVENRPGAGTATGSAIVAKAEPDGYTLLVTSSGYSVMPAMIDTVGFDPARDLAGVIAFGDLSVALIVPVASEHKTVAQFVANAKSKPGAFNFASLGVGSGTYMSAERFRLSAGYDAVHVPFKSGAEALTEIVAGRIDYYFCPVGTALPFITEGKVRVLVVGNPTRSIALPELQTSLEAGYPNSDYATWLGMLAPARTPVEIIDRLHQETLAAMKAPDVAAKLAQNSLSPMPMSPREFTAQIEREIKQNAALVAALKINKAN